MIVYRVAIVLCMFALSVSSLTWEIIEPKHRPKIQAMIDARARYGKLSLRWDDSARELALDAVGQLKVATILSTFSLNTHLKYVAYIYKYRSEYSGERSFYTNLKQMRRIDIVDLNQPLVGDEFIDVDQFYAVALVDAQDQYSNEYVVELFFTNQQSIGQNDYLSGKLSWEIIEPKHRPKIQAMIDARARYGQLSLRWDDSARQLAFDALGQIKVATILSIFSLNTHLKYVAYIYKYRSEYSGERSFYTNLKQMQRIDIVDLNQPFVGDEFIDVDQFYAVGLVHAQDQYFNIYVVELFLTNQPRYAYTPDYQGTRFNANNAFQETRFYPDDDNQESRHKSKSKSKGKSKHRHSDDEDSDDDDK